VYSNKRITYKGTDDEDHRTTAKAVHP
jgi:hypothetical protein